MVEKNENRFNRLKALAPRRFHITSNPPFGVGLVLCDTVLYGYGDEEHFFGGHEGIRNCKPGIWTSMTRHVPKEKWGRSEDTIECILRWVDQGTIDLSQSVEDWEAYEEATRAGDAEVKVASMLPVGVKWKRAGLFYSEGLSCVLSSEYMTRDAGRAVMCGDDETDENGSIGYLEILTLSGIEDWSPGNENFCIGGMNFEQASVSSHGYGPARVAVAEDNGQVIAVRIYAGNDEEDPDNVNGFEEGFGLDED